MSIVAKDVKKSFGMPETLVLKGVSFEVRDGEFVALTGRSGSGKSTLLYVISTLDIPSAGDVVISGNSLRAMASHELHLFRNTSIGFVFQFHHLLPELTAIENVLMPAMKSKRHAQLRPYAQRLLDEMGIGDKADRFPRQLSGGEQQRVAIARALVMSPKYIFADEPTGNLDSINGDIVMKLLRKINRESGTTVIYVTHDPGFASLADRQIRLVDGQLA